MDINKDKFMKVQRSVGDDVGGNSSLETVRIYFYALKDPFTNEIRYIGQTINPDNRRRNHLYEAKKNNRTHKERWIIQLLRKNAMFIFDILWEEIMTSDEANSFETYMIAYYKEIGCNLTNTEDRARNDSIIETTKVYQFDMDCNFIAEFPNANRAMLLTGVNDAAIGEVCRNLNKTGNKSRGGFMWSFDRNFKKAYVKLDSSKRTLQYSLDGELLASFISAREASRITGVCYKRISANINHRQNTAGGFVWKLDEDMI